MLALNNHERRIMTSFNRRAFILTGIVALGTSLASTPSRAEETLVVVGQGGSYQEAQRKAFFEPFTKETGIRIIDQSPSDPAKFQAMVESGNVEWDVVDVDQEFVYRGSKLNLFEKIDYATAGVKAEDFDAGLISDY